MATQIHMIPSRVAPAACWERFQSELAVRVRECNVESGDLLWLISRTDGPIAHVSVESAIHPGDCIDCSFDAELGTVTCAPGPILNVGVRLFQWSGDRFVQEGRAFTIEEAAWSVLDELVCTDDDD